MTEKTNFEKGFASGLVKHPLKDIISTLKSDSELIYLREQKKILEHKLELSKALCNDYQARYHRLLKKHGED